MSIPRRLLHVLVPAALVLGACGGPPVQTVRVRRPAVTAPTPSPAPVFEHPLTGVLFTGPQDWQGRPPLAVKVENAPAARPQAGLEAADVVYEELAEGGITRFIAVFHSRGADVVGPVRSARRVDPDVLAALGGLFAFAGGVPPVLAAVRATPDITDVSMNREPSAYWRRSGRAAPHNLYTSTSALWKGRAGSPPQPLFSFLPQGQPPPPGAAGTNASLAFGTEDVRYVYDPAAGVYRRFHGTVPHLLESGTQVSPVNVIVQMVAVRDGSTVDANGMPSPESRVLGAGDAILLTGGQAYRGRWVRGSLREPTRFVDATGQPLLLGRGQTWVELLPAGRPVAVS